MSSALLGGYIDALNASEVNEKTGTANKQKNAEFFKLNCELKSIKRKMKIATHPMYKVERLDLEMSGLTL